jgi:hypothetical protein
VRSFGIRFSCKPLANHRNAITGRISTGSGPTNHSMEGTMTTYTMLQTSCPAQVTARTIARSSFETTWIGGPALPSGYVFHRFRQQKERYKHERNTDLFKSILKEKEEMKPTADQRVTVFSPTRMARFGRALLVSTIMGVLLVPVFLLFLVPMSHLLMAMTSAGFILFFALIMSVVTEGRVYEVFVGTAT